jgi:ribosome-binding factor A
LLEREVNDPRLSRLISVTRVETSTDLRHAKIFVSILGGESSKTEVIEGFTTATNFLRRKLASCVRLRAIPELSFYYDDSIEQGSKVLKVLDQISGSNNSKPLSEEKPSIDITEYEHIIRTFD